MEILLAADASLLELARAMVNEKRALITFDAEKTDLYIDVTVTSGVETCRAVMEGGHTNLVLLEKNGQTLSARKNPHGENSGHAYRERLSTMTLTGIIDVLDFLDQEDLAYIQSGVVMNLAIAEAGKELQKVGYYIADLLDKGSVVRLALCTSPFWISSFDFVMSIFSRNHLASFFYKVSEHLA